MTAGKDLIAGLFPGRRRGAGRIALVDVARGVAILAMVIYHVAWDLFFLGFITTDITNEPGWVLFQRAIVTSFLLLVGIGLTLAHSEGIRWRAFWRRFVVIVAAALLVTIGTYIALPEYFVFFGVLHAIALFSLLGLGFVRFPWWIAGLGALIFLLPPAFITDPVMSQRPLSWIGFWPVPPMTTDIVPVFPWFGVVLLGIAGTRLIMRSPAWAGITGLRLDGPAGKVLRAAGRWSLLIYLVHQPLIYGGLSLIPRQSHDEVAFVQSCEETCQANGGEASFCARYCLCALEQTNAQSLWDDIETAPMSDEVVQMTRLCEAMAQ